MTYQQLVELVGGVHNAGHLIDALSSGNPDDMNAFAEEGLFECWLNPDNPNRTSGYTDWIGFLPSCGRASWMTNADPIWFDAPSLDWAVQFVKTADEEAWGTVGR